MNRRGLVGLVLTGAAVAVGFAVGFGIGQKTREATPSNVSAEYKDGKAIIVADVENALKTGVAEYLHGLIN